MKRFRVSYKTLSFAIIFAFLTLICMTGVSSAVVYHSNEVISTDTTWSANVHVINGYMTVNDNVKLTISAGAVVKFNSGAYMNVMGTLNATGTSDDKIAFTSLKDDSHGGDTNNDANATSPSPGDWSHIRFYGKDANNGIGIFEHSIVRYGGSSNNYPANLFPQLSDSFSFRNSVCEHSARNGIYLSSTNSGNIISNNITTIHCMVSIYLHRLTI